MVIIVFIKRRLGGVQGVVYRIARVDAKADLQAKQTAERQPDPARKPGREKVGARHGSAFLNAFEVYMPCAFAIG